MILFHSNPILCIYLLMIGVGLRFLYLLHLFLHSYFNSSTFFTPNTNICGIVISKNVTGTSAYRNKLMNMDIIKHPHFLNLCLLILHLLVNIIIIKQGVSTTLNAMINGIAIISRNILLQIQKQAVLKPP